MPGENLDTSAVETAPLKPASALPADYHDDLHPLSSTRDNLQSTHPVRVSYKGCNASFVLT